MVVHLCLSRSHQSYWSEFSLKGIDVNVNKPKKGSFRNDVRGTPSYFWGRSLHNTLRRFTSIRLRPPHFPVHPGYAEARQLVGDGTVADIKFLSLQARELIEQIFAQIKEGTVATPAPRDGAESVASLESAPSLVQLSLSWELEQWKTAQHALGNILPPKGRGLRQASDKVVAILGVHDWPEALKTNNALFGCGIASLLMGAADAPTMFSNYVTDMAFYYEHGYNRVFPSLETLLQKGQSDPYALRTLGGSERRRGVHVGKWYIQHKIALEDTNKTCLMNRSARLTRRMAQVISLSESSLLGMATEAVARGFDPGAIMSDLVFSSPGTDVVDVGCDLVNSEVMNSFLNVTDITDTGIVTEDALRKIYDAYAATGARMLTERWHEPIARMCAALYTWHIQNDRHMFFRRALLGWSKARKTPAQPPREADFDEVFDKEYRTTGFLGRPLTQKYNCNGHDTCDHVAEFLAVNRHETLLADLWSLLVTRPLQYVRAGKVDDQVENELIEGSRVCMATLFARGLVLEMVWLIAHANFHAWQVNYLFEAAMFGSILDGGKLAGKLDRVE